MAAVKRNQPPLVSTEAANRIWSFANDLVTLCKQYEVQIEWRDNGLIELVDERRTCYPSGYECDATFSGCNGDGIELSIEDLQPCDWYVAEAKR